MVMIIIATNFLQVLLMPGNRRVRVIWQVYLEFCEPQTYN